MRDRKTRAHTHTHTLINFLFYSVEQKPQTVSYKNNQTVEQSNTQQSNQTNQLAQLVDLPEVFEYLGLSKYTDVFVHQEVRLRSFRLN